MGRKVGIITGGASGIGLAVAEALAARHDDWELHLLDVDARSGEKAAQQLQATFHQVNVCDYQPLAAVFKRVFKLHSRLDFVFANAGVVERDDYYTVHDTGEESPPPPDVLPIAVNATAVITTCYLAQHYFRQSPRDGSGPRSIIITASCGGLYAVPASSIYGASKFAALGFTRNIAGPFWKNDGIRVNAICPSAVETNILPAEVWAKLPKEFFVPLSKLQEVALLLLDGDESRAEGKPLIGQTVELSGEKHYFRKQADFCDDAMAAMMGSTGVTG